MQFFIVKMVKIFEKFNDNFLDLKINDAGTTAKSAIKSVGDQNCNI